MRKPSQLTELGRLQQIAQIIEKVDYRASFADGPVAKTQHEISDEEFRQIYRLAKGIDRIPGVDR